MNKPIPADQVHFAGHSDIGRRKHNEDAFLIDPDLGLLVVADGVGGHHSGEVASALTIEVIRREVAAGNDLASAMQLANIEVKEGVASGKGKEGMATTVVALRLLENHYELAWVGDSRAYLWDGQLKLLTRDHSFVEAQLLAGKITLDEARTHPRRHVIMQAIGLQQDNKVQIGSNSGRLGAGNTLLLCSDGVSDPLDDGQLSRLLESNSPAQDISVDLVNTSLQCGGKDNSTAVIAQYKRETTIETGTPDKVIWTFNPDTQQYKGLQGSTPGSERLAEDLEETQMSQHRVNATDETDNNPLSEVAASRQGTSKWRYFLLAGLVGISLVLLLLSISR